MNNMAGVHIGCECKIVLHPTHPDYCNECIYRGNQGECKNEYYVENIYKVVCIWHICKYKKLKNRRKIKWQEKEWKNRQ